MIDPAILGCKTPGVFGGYCWGCKVGKVKLYSQPWDSGPFGSEENGFWACAECAVKMLLGAPAPILSGELAE